MGAGLRVRDLCLAYPLPGGGRLEVLDLPRFTVPAGTSAGVTGASGSGKTSLLYAITGIERPGRGSIDWDGIDLARLGEGARDRWRRETVGFVFQDFHLFPRLSMLDNVLLPTTFARLGAPRGLRARARALLARVGLEKDAGRVDTLSRGEMQRVALARALLLSPAVIVADEPTASLDGESARIVGELLLAACAEAGSTLLIVTHDRHLLARLDAVYTLAGGRIAAAGSGGAP